MTPIPKYRSSNMYMSNFQNVLEPGHEPNMIKKYNPKFPQNFDSYLTPDELKAYVFNSPKIQLVLESIASNTKQSRKDLDRKAKQILNEIGLARKLSMIRVAGMAITRLGRRCLKGLYVNEASISRVRDQLGNTPVLYLPSHRSYCDFVLMSYVCFKYDIEIPGIAAGMNLFEMIGMGTYLRTTGAFYMRRSFTGDELYWELFREYVHALVTVYHIGVEFFIEGTRSRNFKALSPKIGLLSMALEPLFSGQVADIMIVPVSVSYDRVLEEQAFVYEMLGVPKSQESTAGFLKALKIFGERFGSWYFDFGEPISAVKFFGDELNSAENASAPDLLQKLNKNQLGLVKNLAYEVVHRQQENIVIFTFNLVALYYAYSVLVGRQINMEQLCDGVLMLKRIFEHFGAHVVPNEENIRTEVMEAIEVHSNVLYFQTPNSKLELVRPALQASTTDLKRLKGHNLNPPTMQIGVSSFYLQLYINPCIFWMTGPSIMILAAMKLTQQGKDEILKDQLRSQINDLSSLFSQEFVIVPDRQETDFLKNLEILSHFTIILPVDDRIRFARNETSDMILSSIVPFICCYFQVIETILEKFSTDEFTDKELMIAVQQRVESLLAANHKFIHPYCLSLDNINIALSSLVQNSYVEKRKNSTVTKYFANNTELMTIHARLQEYLELLPFIIDEHCLILAKL